MAVMCSLDYTLDSPGKCLNHASVWELLQTRQSDSPAAAGIAEPSGIWHWQVWQILNEELVFVVF